VAARRKVKPLLRFCEEQKQWDRELCKETGLAIGQWLTDGEVDLSRSVRSLTRHELIRMSWAAITTCQELRERRERELANRPDPLLADGNSATPG
jgi:hypothetical protein